jgi:hypothetical protein
MTNETVMRAVLRVGDGRGFVVKSRNSNGGPERIVITAAHCLPFFPPCAPAASLQEYTYRDLIGPLDASPTVWAECVFVDPRADIAVLEQPDNQDRYDEAEACNRLMKDMEALPVAAAPAQGRHGAGYVLTLDGKWKQGRLKRLGHTLGFEPERYIVPGMSGSPIVSTAGAAIGVISTGHEGSEDAAFDRLMRLNPVLLDCLPAWLTKRLALREREARLRRR